MGSKARTVTLKRSRIYACRGILDRDHESLVKRDFGSRVTIEE